MEQQLQVEADLTTVFPPTSEVVRMASPRQVGKPGYYGLPILKRPLWGWEIALYFFSEGVGSGCFVLAAAADFFGDGRYRRLTRAAHYISMATVLPCAPLLIHDLGRPERFHHMLRIFKPRSPMNLGAWALTGFAQAVAVLALSEYGAGPVWLRTLVGWAPQRVVNILGLPFALVMLSYPGVLLSTTSTPVWTRTRLTGALLASSSMSTAAAALALGNALDPRSNSRTGAAIGRIESITRTCEAGVLAAFLWQSGPAADPLTRGRYSRLFWLGAVGGGLALSALAGALRGKKQRRVPTIASALLTLAGGLALKWAVVHAGRESALDPAANRHATQPTPENPGWHPISPIEPRP